MYAYLNRIELCNVRIYVVILTNTVIYMYMVASLTGSLVGAYFIAKQMPYEGPGVYYDILTSAGGAFIDPRAMLRSVGLGRA